MMPHAVTSLWRYPIKSMAGEELLTTQVTARGLVGDRGYALVDRSANKVATVRTWGADLLKYRAEFVGEPQRDSRLPAARITTPESEVLITTHPDIDARLSAALGRRALTLMAQPPSNVLLEVPAGTLSGAYAATTDFPLGGAAPGTFFDYGAVHLIAASTIARLQSAHRTGRIDIRRFRPNIVVETDGEPFLENAWVGRTIALGEEVVLRVTIPCPRCVVTTLAQSDLPRDPAILRTIADLNTRDLGDFGQLPCVGVYADVVRAGTLRHGDTVRVTN